MCMRDPKWKICRVSVLSALFVAENGPLAKPGCVCVCDRKWPLPKVSIVLSQLVCVCGWVCVCVLCRHGNCPRIR